MKIAVKTRESKRENDYDWEDYFPSNRDVITEATRFVRALEGSDVDSRFAAFVRSQTETEPDVVVSVDTKRRDDVGGAGRGRPIRTMAFFRAETTEESNLLAAFFAECLRKPDKETLYNADSPLAQAVESLYRTKKTDEFLAFCKSLKPVDGKGGAPEKRWAIPRNGNGEGERNLLADALPAAITGDSSFLFALTDRPWTTVYTSLDSMSDWRTIWIFSKATTAKEPIPGGPPNTRAVAAAIGGTVLLALLVAAIGGPCSRRSGGGEAFASTNSRGRAVESRDIATNAQANIGLYATNTVPTEGRSIEPADETRPGGVSSNAAPASSETPAAVTNNAAESLAIRNEETK